MFQAIRWRGVLAGSASAVLLLACGGGGSTPAPVELGLAVGLTPSGTQILCSASRPVQVRLTRTQGAQVSVETVACPSARMLTGDHVLSQWEATPVPTEAGAGASDSVARTQSALPPPLLVRNGDQLLVLPDPAVQGAGQTLTIERVDAQGRPVESIASSGKLESLAYAGEPALWRWSAQVQGTTYVSTAAAPREFAAKDLGYWGAMALGDPVGPDGTRLFSNIAHPGLPARLLTNDREFRDVRYADLDGDGRTDFVSNVYGLGCTIIGYGKADGTYDVTVPLGNDGQCIGGHGETLLVADFNGDGLVDVFLPTYERFYLLINQGDRRWAESAESAGITFPDYTPRVEGAAAVDIDLDGDVDIVVASEVLLNDGQGHFQPMPEPFGAFRVFDEGLSVADIDMDGRWDIVKHDPEYGPRFFWGNSQGGFDDSGLLFGGQMVSGSANGVAVGHLTGNRLPELLLGGGVAVPAVPGQVVHISGQAPRLCLQTHERQFECSAGFFPMLKDAWSDLVMVTDVDGDGVNELIARYGTLKIYGAATAPAMNVFRFDLRDADGRRNQFGRVLTAKCVLDGSLVGMQAVDGGNGFMAQRDYVLAFQSGWCRKVRVSVATPSGAMTLGEFEPGLHELRRTVTR